MDYCFSGSCINNGISTSSGPRRFGILEGRPMTYEDHLLPIPDDDNPLVIDEGENEATKDSESHHG